MSQTARHIIFSGRVQGVGFRFTASNIADRYGITGQVRNLPDGSVEMIAQGHAKNIDNCIQDIKESFQDYITNVKTEITAFDSKYEGFRITF